LVLASMSGCVAGVVKSPSSSASSHRRSPSDRVAAATPTVSQRAPSRRAFRRDFRSREPDLATSPLH
jgi:hypothetical protein